jgi:hypothetical protein
MKNITVILLSILACSAHAANISDVSFLSGCWAVESGNTAVTESWTKPSSNLMQGIAQTRIAQNKVVIEYEFLRIEKKADGTIGYTPYINGQQVMEFLFDEKLSQDTQSYRAVFVNERNDFPKKISYSRPRADDSQISILLEGIGHDGKTQLIQYSLFKADCNQTF